MIDRWLFTRIDNSALILFRILFGGLIAIEAFGAILTGWVRRILIEPEFTFNFIGFGFLQRCADCPRILEIPNRERRARIDGAPVPLGEIVEDRDLMPRVEHLLHANAPDVAGAARDENVHPAVYPRTRRDGKGIGLRMGEMKIRNPQ